MSTEVKQEGEFKIKKRKPALKNLGKESSVTKVNFIDPAEAEEVKKENNKE